MTPTAFLNLAWNSLVAPRDVARLLLSMRLSHEALLLSFALVVVLNALVFGLSVLATPTLPDQALAITSPVILMVMLGGVLGVTTVGLTWMGRALGGTGRIEDVGVLLIWMQALRILVQLVMLVVMPISAGLAALVVFGATAAGVYILVHFLDEAHSFGSLRRALLVLLLGVTGAVLGIALFLSLIGATTMGLNGYV